MTKLLSDTDIETELAKAPGWTRDGNEIGKDFKFGGFPEAVAFVERIVAPAEARQHHPDLEIHYNRVVVRISTHSEGGITAMDFALARDVDAVAGLG